MLDSIVWTKMYYPQTLLEECQYKIKKTLRENLILDELEPSSSDECDSETEFDNESNKESDNVESNE